MAFHVSESYERILPSFSEEVTVEEQSNLLPTETPRGDLVAGITVGLTAIPQSLAYAVVAGADPAYGLYSSFVGCFIYMVFGSVKDVTIGPTAIMSIMTHTYTQNLACYTNDMAVLLTFLTGILILIAAVLRLGFLITFIGRPVISGFTSAAAITIASSQVKGLLGIKFDADGFVDNWIEVFKHIKETRYQDLTLGTVSIVVLLLMRAMRNFKKVKPLDTDSRRTQFWKKSVFLLSVGSNAIIVIIGSLIAYGMRNNQPFSITGEIKAGFPEVSLPSFNLYCSSSNSSSNGTEVYYFSQVLGMFGTGLVIVPLLGVLENIAIASAFSHGKAIDAAQEMIALGMCNFVGSFFQSIPTTGSFTRTAVNSTSGVRTTAGGFATGSLVILALLFLTPAFKYIPNATLAAVIICSVIFSVEFHEIMPMWRSYKFDQIPHWVTFLACLLWALEWGILVGAGVQLCMFLYRQALPPITVKQDVVGKVVVVQPAMGLMFPNAERVKSSVTAAGLQDSSVLVVLDCTHVHVVDYTATLSIKNLLLEFTLRSQRLAFANLNSSVRNSLSSLCPGLQEVDLPCVVDMPGLSSGSTEDAMAANCMKSTRDSYGTSSSTRTRSGTNEL